MLPKDFPDWRAVYNFYDRAKNKGLWEIMMQKLVIINQKKLNVDLKYGIIDSQGHILHIEIHAANIHDTISGCKVVEETLKKYKIFR